MNCGLLSRLEYSLISPSTVNMSSPRSSGKIVLDNQIAKMVMSVEVLCRLICHRWCFWLEKSLSGQSLWVNISDNKLYIDTISRSHLPLCFNGIERRRKGKKEKNE